MGKIRDFARQHRGWVAAAAGLGVVGIVVVLVWFQPQKLFIDERVDEPSPLDLGAGTTTTLAATTTTTSPTTTTTATDGTTTTTTTSTTSPTTTTTTVAPEPVVVHRSEFIGVGHEGTGDVLVIELPEGGRVIRFENLDISNGPDLRVILSPSPLVEDRDAYDDGDFYDLGPLEGNQGNQNYDVPADVDVSPYMTVAIWCRRFNYTFNAATIG